MRTLIIIAFFSTCNSVTLLAQNLVPNPSFELYNTCPPSAGGLGIQGSDELFIMNWYSMNLTPDYMHECAGPGASNYPQDNAWGYQEPFEGEAYVNIITINQFENEREYIAVELSEPLVINELYQISLWVSDADGGSLEDRECSSNNLGIQFFTDPAFYWQSFQDQNSLEPNNFSHVNESDVVIDSLGWHEVEGEFIADMPYTHMVIGNFFTDSNTIITASTQSDCASNYYIDFVCVSSSPAGCSTVVDGLFDYKEDLFNIYPNPIYDMLHLDLGEGFPGGELVILDELGRKVKDATLDSGVVHSIDLTGLGPGIYKLVIANKQDYYITNILKL